MLQSATIDAAVRHLRLGRGRCWGCRATIYSVEDVCLIADRAAPSIILTGVRMTELGVAPLAGAGSQISRTFIRCSHGAS